jgi:hypothetical protein
MLQKGLLAIGIIVLVGGLMAFAIPKVVAGNLGEDMECPPGYAQVVNLEPIQAGDSSSTTSNVSCEPIVQAQVEFLEPIKPGDEGWEIKPYEPTEKSEVVFGPSQESVYRCVFFLEPIQPGEQESKESEPVCSSGPIDSINGISLDSSYLIAKFYDNTNYGSLLVEYYGPSGCSASVSYGKTTLPSNLDNKFASGSSYSGCNVIEVFDFTNYTGPTYSCGPNCFSFYALNDHVSSWRTGD